MKTERKIVANLDWLTLAMYASLVIMGWLNVHAVGYHETISENVFHLSRNASKQLIWIGTTVIIFIISILLDAKFYQLLAYVFYAFAILFLMGILLFGVKAGGHNSWYQVGEAKFQPSEFAKLACALAIAKYLSKKNTKLQRPQTQLVLLLIILLPVTLVMLQGDIGSSLVFASFIIVFYREGFPPVAIIISLFVIALLVLTLLVPQAYLVTGVVSLAFIIIGIGRRSLKKVITVVIAVLAVIVLTESVDLIMTKALKSHQQNRIKALINPNVDPLGIGWNVTQSKIAIGSGGFWGKGFLKGTQTKFDFVPEQSTDFIFCTIGEEHGWVGAFIVISIFIGLLSRILYLAERQRLRFTRVYGYAVASILFFHFMINIGMTIGLMPVIGIPLPFFSYGGSSLWSFSLMLFVLLKLDAERKYYGFG